MNGVGSVKTEPSDGSTQASSHGAAVHPAMLTRANSGGSSASIHSSGSGSHGSHGSAGTTHLMPPASVASSVSSMPAWSANAAAASAAMIAGLPPPPAMPSLPPSTAFAAAPPPPPPNAFYTPEGHLFYAVLLQMPERGQLVNITSLAIMDPGFPVAPHCRIEFKPAPHEWGRGESLHREVLRRYYSVDAFFYADPTLSEAQRAKQRKEYIRFFQHLSGSGRAAAQEQFAVVSNVPPFTLKGPLAHLSATFDEREPVLCFFSADKINRSMPQWQPSSHVQPPLDPAFQKPPSPIHTPYAPPHVPPYLHAAMMSYAHPAYGAPPVPPAAATAAAPPPFSHYPASTAAPPLPSAVSAVPSAHDPSFASMPALEPAVPTAASAAPAPSTAAPSSSASAATPAAPAPPPAQPALPATDQPVAPSAPLGSGGVVSVSLSHHFLRDLTHQHDWVFGALAELVHNSHDAGAKNCRISVKPMGSTGLAAKPHLIIDDDGSGMTHRELRNALMFGRVVGRERSETTIGKFGFGLKHGSMKLGDDCLVLTKSAHSFSIGLLSLTYNKSQSSVKVPIVTWLAENKTYDLSVHTAQEANEGEDVIQKYSAFNRFDVGKHLAQMARTGTRIVIWNLRRNDAEAMDEEKKEIAQRDAAAQASASASSNGSSHAVQLGDSSSEDEEEEDPARRQRLQQHKEKLKSLAAARQQQKKPTKDEAYQLKFDTVADDLQLLIDPISNMQERSNQMSTDGHTFKPTQSSFPLDYSLRAYLSVMFLDRRMTSWVQGKKVEPLDWSTFLSKTRRYECTVKHFSGCSLLVGYSEVERDRGNAGMMLYWRSTLIETYRRVGIQASNSDAGLGVIGVMDVGDGLEPSNNKQRFPPSSKRFKKLLQWLSTTLDEYWHDVLGRDKIRLQTSEFAAAAAAGRIEQYNQAVECDRCRKWRAVSQREIDIIDGKINEDGTPGDGKERKWYCYMNKDPRFNSCQIEQDPSLEDEIVIGVSRGAAPDQPTSNEARSNEADGASKGKEGKAQRKPSSSPTAGLQRAGPSSAAATARQELANARKSANLAANAPSSSKPAANLKPARLAAALPPSSTSVASRSSSSPSPSSANSVASAPWLANVSKPGPASAAARVSSSSSSSSIPIPKPPPPATASSAPASSSSSSSFVSGIRRPRDASSNSAASSRAAKRSKRADDADAAEDADATEDDSSMDEEDGKEKEEEEEGDSDSSDDSGDSDYDG